MRFTEYIDYDTMLDTVSEMARENPEIVKVVELSPRTFGNRSIVALELRSDKFSRKPGILIIGALHAMAWGATNAILELSDKLLYDSNYQTPFFNDYDWYMIPMANPDGINFTQSRRSLSPLNELKWAQNLSTHETHRPEMWHKNVDKQPGHYDCFGTNVNRNFAYHWQDDVRKTPDSCSPHYPGPKPFSSAEAQAIRKYVDDLGGSIRLAMHLHASYVPKKEYILYPWRYSMRPPSNHRTLQLIGEYAARQARLANGRLYEVHQSSSDARVAGTLCDYLSGVVGTELVYLVKPYHELSPNVTYADLLETYAQKSIAVLLSLVRGWRSSTKQNTLSFFGKSVEY